MTRPEARRRAGTWRRFRRHRPALASAGLLFLLALSALTAPLVAWLTGSDPHAVNLLERSLPPEPAHPLGTDELGRDQLVRLLYGGRISLIVGIGGALGASLIGLGIGLAAGFAGGRTDAILMRLTDLVLALPILPLLIVLAAVDLGKLGLEAAGPSVGILRIVLIIALFGWPTVARVVRAETLSLRRRDFVLAAEALGLSVPRLLRRHVLPNVAGPVLVATTLAVGQVILAESVLSFLGLGIQPPVPSWGNMLTNAQDLLWEAPHLAIFPGLMIFVTVVSVNFLGDGLSEALEPRTDRL